MGLFGRRRRDHDEARDDDDYDNYDDYDNESYDGEALDPAGGEAGGDLFDDAGPYDVEDAPEDGVNRLDLGALRLPVRDNSQLKVKLNPDGSASEIYIITELCVITVSVFAAPRSSGLWRDEWCGDLARDMRAKKADVHSATGVWGQELVVTFPGEVLRFVGVDGPRWMMRAAVSSLPERVENAAAALYELVRGTVVVRGEIPMPVGMPLPLQLPPAIAQHIAAQAAAGNA